jgi:hypothetical protein
MASREVGNLKLQVYIVEMRKKEKGQAEEARHLYIFLCRLAILF